MHHTRLALLMLAFFAVTAVHAADSTLPPKRLAPLLRWLKAGTYRATYTPEPAVRVSSTAHGLHVRSWYSPVLVADLAGGTLPFRPGAAMVKELYEGPDSVVGWAVMRKLRPNSAGGRGWFFFETLDGRRVVTRGRGKGICVGCHAAGTDFLLSDFRPAP